MQKKNEFEFISPKILVADHFAACQEDAIDPYTGKRYRVDLDAGRKLDAVIANLPALLMELAERQRSLK